MRTGKTNLVKFVGDNIEHGNLFNSNKIVELSLFQCKLDCSATREFLICHVYKHPSMKNKEFKIELRDFLLKQKVMISTPGSNDAVEKYMFKKKIFFLGDFNIDFLSKKKEETQFFIERFFMKYGLSMLINTKAYPSTTDNKTLLDWCLSNARTSDNLPEAFEGDALVYESCYSDHKPLWLEVMQK